MQTMSEPDPICIHCDLMEHDLCVGSVFCACRICGIEWDMHALLDGPY